MAKKHKRKTHPPPLLKDYIPRQAPETQGPTTGGLLVSEEYTNAVQKCREDVKAIVEYSQKTGRKFRDVEFDLELDRRRCLFGLVLNKSPELKPTDAERVTEIFLTPKFFVEGADRSNVVQGSLEDCWFLSALATMANTQEKLLEKLCRNEDVGVYGFVFFHNAKWEPVIIDDFLYVSVPKFEELRNHEKQLYHYNQQLYEEFQATHGKFVYFAKSGIENETWVSLIEKAYAKLHGCYAALRGGDTGEAIEDLTGTVNGLISNHAYSILRAKVCDGNHLLVIRNPWGIMEWRGPWSDGSKEWTEKTILFLKELQHSINDADGQFVMEFTISLEMASPAVIALSKLDERPFRMFSLPSWSSWSFDFVVFKRGETRPCDISSPSLSRSRSVNVYVPNLLAGEFASSVMILQRMMTWPRTQKNQPPGHRQITTTQPRVLYLALAKKIKSEITALNSAGTASAPISTSLDILAGKDLSEIEFNDRGTFESSEDLGDHGSVPKNNVHDHDFPTNYGGSADGNGNGDSGIVLGLRVYTHKGSPVTIASQLRLQTKPPCPALKPPLTFYDRHLDKRLARLSKVVLAPSLLSDLAKTVDHSLDNIWKKLPSVEEDFPHPKSYAGSREFEPVADAKGIAMWYHRLVSGFVARVSSMLSLHPHVSSWSTSVYMMSRNTSRKPKYYALYENFALEFLAPYEPDPARSLYMIDEPAWDALSNEERLLLQEVTERFPCMAPWQIFFVCPDTERALQRMNNLATMENFPAASPGISIAQYAPVDTQSSTSPDANGTDLSTSLSSLVAGHPCSNNLVSTVIPLLPIQRSLRSTKVGDKTQGDLKS
ncbi:hypothetical protein H0H92_007582 [Tricholoma furcatifolium]|nr:hypothetical protein H0H92_007582 [Tricholoma furcatifolium]